MSGMKEAGSIPTTADVAAQLVRLSPQYAPTPLMASPELARELGVSQVLVKNEGHRLLGSFKSLGGGYAGLRALALAAGKCIEELVAVKPRSQQTLICASDGNHGLAVAMAARLAGAPSRVYLHTAVPRARASRIERQGAHIKWVRGTYDDAVDAAASDARQGGGILVADTTDDPDDATVGDVMAGYGVIAEEIRTQLAGAHRRPTHLFVQAGVGGLAAALAEGLADWLAAPAGLYVVEPDKAPAVAAALKGGRPVRVSGDLQTTAEMLSCGEASAPAIVVLRRHLVTSVLVSEQALDEAAATVRKMCSINTTSSGAAGLAGALAMRPLPPEARVLLVVTERDADDLAQSSHGTALAEPAI